MAHPVSVALVRVRKYPRLLWTLELGGGEPPGGQEDGGGEGPHVTRGWV